MYIPMILVLQAFDGFLVERDLAFEGTVIGGAPLKEDWLNNAPAALIRDLPAGWRHLRRNWDMNSTLNDRLRTIGFRLVVGAGAPKGGAADIERTLLEAVEEFPRDARLASLLLSWIKVHGACVIVEKLRKLAREREASSPGSTRWLAAPAAFAVIQGDHRWKMLVRRSKEPLYLFPREVTETAVRMKGAVDWLGRVNIRVPQGSLRIREDDVLDPRALIRRNAQYRNRYVYGPCWRADIVTAIEHGLRSPAEIARATGCSYEPAYRVFRQISMVKP
jgi:hypothetical protein